MNPSDLEKGGAEGSGFNNQQAQLSSFSSNRTGNNEKSKHENDLKVFQALVGVHFLAPGGGLLPESEKDPRPANPIADILRPAKTGASRFRNRGLYDRALSQELKNRVLYSGSYYIITGLYILQILLAATFTAISAYQSNLHVVLTVLGAINTVVAGMLAWLTGQGMPVRFRRARDRYRAVVKAIETSERMFAEIDLLYWPQGERPNPIKERDKLDEMFESARIDQEANYPEVHYDPSAGKEQDKELEEQAKKWKDQEKELKSEAEALREELKAFKNSTKLVLGDNE